MVKTVFTVRIPAKLDDVWAYFSVFQNLAYLNKSLTYIASIKRNFRQVGSIYSAKYILNKKCYLLTYETVEYKRNSKIIFKSETSQICINNEVSFQQGENMNQSVMIYRSNIKLKGINWLLTPLIKRQIIERTKKLRNNVIQKCGSMFGITL